ncbi:hypothetical protein AAVH_19678 [Aphelenchoides avenae]|nr:hypothetical protein AAVH_19678 [Aphelenchus avenae]
MLTEAALSIVLILHLLAYRYRRLHFRGVPRRRSPTTLPSTVLVDILSCLKRRDLDVLELGNQALGAVVDTHEKHLPRRSLSLTFFNEWDVSLVSFKDTTKQVPVVELPPYLPRSVITKMLFRSTHTVTMSTYKGLRTCREYFAEEAACFFPSTFRLQKGLLLEFYTTLLPCHTLIIPHRIDNKAGRQHTGRLQGLPRRPPQELVRINIHQLRKILTHLTKAVLGSLVTNDDSLRTGGATTTRVSRWTLLLADADGYWFPFSQVAADRSAAGASRPFDTLQATRCSLKQHWPSRSKWSSSLSSKSSGLVNSDATFAVRRYAPEM